MAEEPEGMWRNLKLTDEERDCVETEDIRGIDDATMGPNWLIGKLITKRQFNKKAILGTLSVVWRLSKEAVVSILDENLFLFKFVTKNDKQKVMAGSPWSFDKQLIAFKDNSRDLRASDCV